LGYSLFTVADLPVAGLMNMPEDGQKTGAPPHWIGYVGVDDVDSVVDRIKQLGGAVHVPPTDVPGISRFSIVGVSHGDRSPVGRERPLWMIRFA
jgi:hypothetical protein